MPDELDDDLQGLLDQLTDEEFAVIPDAPEPDDLELENEPEPESDEPDPILDLKPSDTVVKPAEDLHVEDSRRYEGSIVQAGEDVDTGGGFSPELEKYYQRMDDVTGEVLQACRSDRQETQDVINECQSAISIAKGKNVAPARMWVDALVKAVEVKAGINSTAVKMVEANVKLLAATKSGIQINQQINAGVSSSLEDILSDPIGDDDEF